MYETGVHAAAAKHNRTLRVQRQSHTDSFGCRLNSAPDLVGFTWISEIVPNEAFDRSGNVRENDIIVKVAGKDMLVSGIGTRILCDLVGMLGLWLIANLAGVGTRL